MQADYLIPLLRQWRGWTRKHGQSPGWDADSKEAESDCLNVVVDNYPLTQKEYSLGPKPGGPNPLLTAEACSLQGKLITENILQHLRGFVSDSASTRKLFIFEFWLGFAQDHIG